MKWLTIQNRRHRELHLLQERLFRATVPAPFRSRWRDLRCARLDHRLRQEQKPRTRRPARWTAPSPHLWQRRWRVASSPNQTEDAEPGLRSLDKRLCTL